MPGWFRVRAVVLGDRRAGGEFGGLCMALDDVCEHLYVRCAEGLDAMGYAGRV